MVKWVEGTHSTKLPSGLHTQAMVNIHTHSFISSLPLSLLLSLSSSFFLCLPPSLLLHLYLPLTCNNNNKTLSASKATRRFIVLYLPIFSLELKLYLFLHVSSPEKSLSRNGIPRFLKLCFHRFPNYTVCHRKR